MSEAVSLSLEETNRLRIKAGLKPIPIPETEKLQGNEEQEDDVISLSVAETNKLRAKVGLPLIPVDSSQKDTASENFDKHQKSISKVRENEELLQRINDAKFRSNKRKFVNNATLVGEDSKKELDTDEWLNNLINQEDGEGEKHKKQKVPKKKKGNDEVLAVIGHSVKELKSLGDGEILTLKDTDLLDDNDEEEEDVLTSESLSRKAKLKKDLDEKREAENIKFNGRHYRHNDDNIDVDGEDDENNDALLVSDKVIINKNTVNLAQTRVKGSEEKKNVASFTNLFDDIEELDKDDKAKVPIKMKKIKKRKINKTQKQRKIEGVGPVELISVDDEFDENENELSQSLFSSRNKKLQSRSEFTPEQLAEEIAANRRWEFERKLEKESLTNVYDDTAGFLNNLENNILSDNDIPNENKVEEDKEGNGSHLNGDASHANGNTDREEDKIPKFDGGLAETLKFLKSRNIIDSQSNNTQAKSNDVERQEVAKESELLRMKISIEERILKEELNKDKSYMRMAKTERGAHFEKLLDSRLKAKGIVIKDENLQRYNPKVELTYKDDLGNVLDRKKAWKEFSHKYHGTGLDKNKNKSKKK